MTVHHRTATGEIPAYDTWIPDKRLTAAELIAIVDRVVEIIEAELPPLDEPEDLKEITKSLRAAARYEGDLADHHGMLSVALSKVARDLPKRQKKEL